MELGRANKYIEYLCSKTGDEPKRFGNLYEKEESALVQANDPSKRKSHLPMIKKDASIILNNTTQAPQQRASKFTSHAEEYFTQKEYHKLQRSLQDQMIINEGLKTRTFQ